MRTSQVDDEEEHEERSGFAMMAGCAGVAVLFTALLCCGSSALGCALTLFLPDRPASSPVAFQPAPAPATAVPEQPVALNTRTAGLKPADFSTMEPARWHDADADPPSPLQNFDAVSALPWARELARSWIPDAEFVRSDIDKARPDGSLDLASEDGGSAGYRFYSPSRAKMAEEIGAVSEEVPLTGFRIWISEGVVRVMIADIKAPTTKGWRPLGDTSACDLPALMRSHMAQPKTTRRPTYDLGLRWRWGKHMWTISPGETYYSPTTCKVTRR